MGRMLRRTRWVLRRRSLRLGVIGTVWTIYHMRRGRRVVHEHRHRIRRLLRGKISTGVRGVWSSAVVVMIIWSVVSFGTRLTMDRRLRIVTHRISLTRIIVTSLLILHKHLCALLSGGV